MAGSIRGVFCAAVTPLDEQLRPDHARLVDHVKRLLADGCHGIAMLGSTGEANSFSSAERMAIVEAVVAAGVDPQQLLPGTGLPSFPETVALTRHALSVGVTTVVMLPPFYYKAVSDQGLIDSYSRVIDELADDRLKIILYHIPPISQIAITDGVVSALLQRYPNTVAGIKDSGGDFEHMKALVKNYPSLSILPGADPLMLPMMKEGGAGCITATANIVSSQLRIVFDNFSDPGKTTEVEAAQARIVEMRNLSNSYVQIPTVKALVAHRTKDAGWTRVRPPFVALDATQVSALNEKLG